MQVERNRMYKVDSVATRLKVHKSTVYRDIAAGKLVAVRIGMGKGAVRITSEALGNYLASAGVDVEYVDAAKEVA